jgi:hypothetical protein
MFGVISAHTWRIVMISLIAGNRRLVLISTAILLSMNSALAAEPAFDAQEQARQVILAKFDFGVATDSKTKRTAAVAAQGGLRVDAQEQARRFMLAKSNFGVAADSKTKRTAAVAAQDGLRVDAQEQARQFILAPTSRS